MRSMPVPLAALIRATGQFNSAESAPTSTFPPRRARSSAMLSSTRVGKPRLRIGAASTRFRPRFVNRE